MWDQPSSCVTHPRCLWAVLNRITHAAAMPLLAAYLLPNSPFRASPPSTFFWALFPRMLSVRLALLPHIYLALWRPSLGVILQHQQLDMSAKERHDMTSKLRMRIHCLLCSDTFSSMCWLLGCFHSGHHLRLCRSPPSLTQPSSTNPSSGPRFPRLHRREI